MMKFIAVCLDVLVQAQKEGASMRDLYKIAQAADMPKGPFSTFCTYYWTIRKMPAKRRKDILKPKMEVVRD